MSSSDNERAPEPTPVSSVDSDSEVVAEGVGIQTESQPTTPVDEATLVKMEDAAPARIVDTKPEEAPKPKEAPQTSGDSEPRRTVPANQHRLVRKPPGGESSTVSDGHGVRAVHTPDARDDFPHGLDVRLLLLALEELEPFLPVQLQNLQHSCTLARAPAEKQAIPK
ncbi:zinc metalloprotease ZmpB [Babesia caballi]|uniref:Zinc metalloprotease ZmpB n=1 Tax=Babesia caballi TaxID=5871 RepID=A0AAV4LXK1_BABCB|nr:zinc metalloprotease ZmpB [Babesia caballi]